MKYAAGGDYDLPALVSVGFALYYILFDCLGVLPARQVLRVYYPRCTGPEPFERAFRTQQNQVEQMTVWYVLMWTCAIVGDAPYFAGVVGCVWACFRVMYSILYRIVGRRRLGVATVPAYLCLAALAGRTVYAVALARLGDASAAWWVLGSCTTVLTVATFAHLLLLRTMLQSDNSAAAGN